ncbi:MAG: hypothetical protein K5978_05450 [Campylobacter sp.]|nr:hypothetical protein [Campylobacter sp.]
MAKYLYGASIQGIQEYIYQTNKLQEIVGASEIVANFENKFAKLADSKDIILNAAGNFRAIIDENKIDEIIKTTPKKIMQMAYGITVSQAAVKISDNYKNDSDKLEARLKIQRNRPSLPLDMSINILSLSPKTARPIYTIKDDKLDISSVQKRKAHNDWFDKKRKDNPKFVELKEFNQISNSKNKLAVIHADGNGLGEIVKKLANKTSYNNTQTITQFSKQLDEATKEAFKKAKESIKSYANGDKIKELILSGDDMTCVCSADVALKFTQNFMQEFENLTESASAITDKLTMCAGIAFCNEKYPFHYAVNLAEALCGVAKKEAKNINQNLAPSCLMFHNIQSSNFQNWDKFVNDELSIKNDKRVVRCDFGPYYLNEKNRPKIDDLNSLIRLFNNPDSPKAKLREWLKELGLSDKYAQNMLNRIKEILDNKEAKKQEAKKYENSLKKLNENLSLTSLVVDDKTPIYDILQILSVCGEIQ